VRIYVLAGGRRPELVGPCLCAMPMFGRSACRGRAGMRVCFAGSAAQRRDWYRLWGAIADGKLGKGNSVAHADEWHEAW
jgi:hypothetical protein